MGTPHSLDVRSKRPMCWEECTRGSAAFIIGRASSTGSGLPQSPAEPSKSFCSQFIAGVTDPALSTQWSAGIPAAVHVRSFVEGSPKFPAAIPTNHLWRSTTEKIASYSGGGCPGRFATPRKARRVSHGGEVCPCGATATTTAPRATASFTNAARVSSCLCKSTRSRREAFRCVKRKAEPCRRTSKFQSIVSSPTVFPYKHSPSVMASPGV
mmetsp:Transcript_11606/g.21964  ORF Transcript_11606/g.21964 Transcript_11606/m.21964 type:complete len:211 (+) Transcript_11606:692-1324(+)